MKKSPVIPTQLSDSLFQSEVKRDMESAKTLIFRHDFSYLHPSEHNKKMYLVYENKLREFVVKETTIYPFKSNAHFLMTMRIAGIGEVHVWSSFLNGIPFSVYKSVEDYNAGVSYKPMMAMFYGSTIQPFWGLSLGYALTHYNLGRWFWDGVMPVFRKIEVDVPCYISCNEDGLFFHDGWSAVYINEGYATKKECIEDNNVEVLTLDDTEHEEKEEKTIRLSIEIKESDVEKLKGIVKVI